MASLLLHILDAIFKRMPANGDIYAERKNNAARRPPRPPRGVTVERTEFGGIPCEVVKKAGNTRIPVFYIHGGGFTTGSARERRAITFYLCDRFGFDCIACDYRLAPEHKLPAAHEDCYAAYGAVVQRYPQVVLMGESAGGTLAVSVAMRALKEGIARPAAVAAFSPLAALNTDLPSHKTNVKTDYMLKRDPSSGELLKLICPENAGAEFFKDPIISPVYGTFNNFPPLFLAASDSEILYDDAVMLYQKAVNDGVKAHIEVMNGLLHAWPIITQLPEARKTLKKLDVFLKNAGI